MTHDEALSAFVRRDPITGLWDRESLLAQLFAEADRVQRMGTSLSLLLVDLDRFGDLKKVYGSEAGANVLRATAVRLRRMLRSYDLLGRGEKDEFLIALPGCDVEQATNLASRIRTDLLLRPFIAGGPSIVVTASIGISESLGRSPLVTLREAEIALSTAKQEGGDCERAYSHKEVACSLTIQ